MTILKINPTAVFPKSIILIIALCALVAGLLTFALTGYRASTLVFEANSVQNGQGVIVSEGVIPQKGKRIYFPVRSGLEGYVIELPAMPLNSVRIAPLANSGNLIVNNLTLSNDVISYRWNSADNCSQKYLFENQIIRSKCNPNQPALNLGADGTIQISAIPEIGIRRDGKERLVIAIVSAVGLFLTGMCLCFVIKSAENVPRMQLICNIAVWLVLLSVYVYQLCNIYAYSVDVPYSDDWIFFEPNNLNVNFPLHWLFKQELEHRIVLTKLLGWINLRLFSLNYSVQKVFNYLLFGGLVLSLAFLKNKLIGRGNFILFPLFLLFLLSPIAWENHRWALQSDYHFALLFACLALCYVSPRDITLKSIGLFCVFSGLAMYSLAPGVVLTSVYLSCSVVYLIARIAERTAYPSLRKLLVFQMLVMGLIFCLWFYGYKSPTEAWPHKYLFPWEPGYWSDFLNMISFSFGFQDYHIVPGLVCLCIVLVPLGVLLGRNETRWQSTTWCLIAATGGILVVFAVVTMARSDVNLFGAKTSRYAEVGFLMIPFMAIAWWHVLQSKILRGVVLSLLWIFCFISYYDDWSSQAYLETKQYDLQTLDCAENYYRGTGNGQCRGETFPNPQVLARAKELGVNFTKQFVQSYFR